MREQSVFINLRSVVVLFISISLCQVIFIHINAMQPRQITPRKAVPHSVYIRSFGNIIDDSLGILDIHKAVIKQYDLLLNERVKLDRMKIVYFISDSETLILAGNTILNKNKIDKYNILITSIGFVPDSHVLNNFCSDIYYPYYMYMIKRLDIPDQELVQLIELRKTSFTDVINTFISMKTMSQRNKSLAKAIAILGNIGILAGAVNHFSHLLCCLGALPPVGCLITIYFPIATIFSSSAIVQSKGSLEYAKATFEDGSYFKANTPEFLQHLSEIFQINDAGLRNMSYDQLYNEMIIERHFYYEY